jgi:16S rRNA (adenine1518-N6/adenine1519-N6)-dimethyltransferase
MKLYAPSTIKDIKNRHDFQLSRSLGQNFLTDKNIIDKIVEAPEIGPRDLVIEIGPGIGVLTAEAAKRAAKVVAVEIDRKLIPILKETLAEFDNIEILNQDILKTDIHEILEQNREYNGQKMEGVKIIGNLPYYITTPIIMKILEEGVPADSITIMMQKEVADRLKAPPGSRTYGAISAAVAYYCRVDHVANVPKEVFIPQPKVDSAVLKLSLRKKKPLELTNEKLFFQCIKAGFGQRRKTLLNSLTGVGGYTKEQVESALSEAGIDSKRRAETLGIEEFGRIANALQRKI